MTEPGLRYGGQRKRRGNPSVFKSVESVRLEDQWVYR